MADILLPKDIDVTLSGGVDVPLPGDIDLVTKRIEKYLANGVYFDGVNDFIQSSQMIGGDFSGPACLLSLWFKMIGKDGATFFIFDHTAQRVDLFRISSGLLRFRVKNISNTVLWQAQSISAFSSTVNPGWHHFLATASLGPTPVGQVLIDGLTGQTIDLNVPTTGTIAMNPAFTQWDVGAAAGGASRADIELADVWFDDSHLDLDVEANKRKFISQLGKPLDLGVDGAIPTGSSPRIYFSGGTAGWHNNRGTGGGFTEFGALTDATSSPSD